MPWVRPVTLRHTSDHRRFCIQFLDASMGVDPAEKMITKDRIEKYILRKAFDTSDEPDTPAYLPEKILWRQKEQFSDGVGYGWIDALKDTAAQKVTDEQLKSPKAEWGDDIPDSKEACVVTSQFAAVLKRG